MNEAPPHRYQPKALRCRTLAMLWWFPSLGAVVILVMGFRDWPRVDGPLAVLRSVTLEQWIAAAILLAHPFLFVLARRLAKSEPFREVAPEES